MNVAEPRLDKDLLVHGAEIRQMLTYTDSWVHRRVEQIAFVDDETVSRRVSVDFQLPQCYVEATQGKRWYVPLALLKKGTLLVDFDLRDEEGRVLPLVTSQKAHQIGSAVLINAASTVLEKARRSLGVELAQDLQKVPPCEPEDAEEAIRRVLEPRSADDDRRILRNDPLIEPLIRDLAETFLVLVPITVPTYRSVVKFSFLQFPRDERRSPLVALGWSALVFQLNLSGASMARSYHCEISAPERLELTQGQLWELTGRNVRFARRTASGGRVHFQLDGVSSDAQCLLRVDMRAKRRGLPWMAALLALGISTLLTVGLIFLGTVLGSHDEAAPAILVAIPALLAAYLSAPGEHRLASRLLVGIRWLTGLAGLLVFAAAASLVGGQEHESTVRIVWIVTAGLSWLVTLALIASALLPRADQSHQATN